MSTNSSLEQAAHILTLIGQKKLPMSDLQKFINGGFLSDLLEANPERIDRDELRTLLGLFPIKPRIIVDYNAPFTEMIGVYHSVSPAITLEQFPEHKTGTEEFVVDLKDFAYYISAHAVGHLCKERRGHMATIRELLVLIATFPQVQYPFPIVAVGSSFIIGRCRYLPCVSFDKNKGHMLGLLEHGKYWIPGTLFPFCAPVKAIC